MVAEPAAGRGQEEAAESEWQRAQEAEAEPGGVAEAGTADGVAGEAVLDGDPGAARALSTGGPSAGEGRVSHQPVGTATATSSRPIAAAVHRVTRGSCAARSARAAAPADCLRRQRR